MEMTKTVEEIMQMIPHRYPMLLVDRVLEMELGKTALSKKNVTINEAFFVGHFPRKAVMPGVMIIEAMAQTSAVLVVETLKGDSAGKLVYFMSIEEARFRKPVVPGDTLYIRTDVMQHRKTVWKFRCTAKVDDQLVAEAVITAMMMDE